MSLEKFFYSSLFEKFHSYSLNYNNVFSHSIELFRNYRCLNIEIIAIILALSKATAIKTTFDSGGRTCVLHVGRIIIYILRETTIIANHSYSTKAISMIKRLC